MSFLFEHERKGIEYKGHYIQTYSFGKGDNVVFSFPSFPHSGLYYLWFLSRYPKSNVKFITFDLPCWIGYSENYLDIKSFRIEEYVDIAKEVLKSYDVDKFSVIGYSFGGALAIKLASEIKDSIKQIVIVSSLINGRVIHSPTKTLILLAVKLKQFRRVRNQIFKTFYKIKPIILNNGVSEEQLSLYSDMMSHLNAEVITRSAFQLFTNNWTTYLQAINDKPILIVNSIDEPPMFRQQAGYMRRYLKNEKSIYLHGMHDDFILSPDKKVVRDVLKFLEQ
jgi:pimeloyl-ACP methyl ester carboxylesterase